MEVVIERDLEDDGLFLGRVERRWPHGMSASGYVVICLANGENRSRISRKCVVPLVVSNSPPSPTLFGVSTLSLRHRVDSEELPHIESA